MLEPQEMAERIFRSERSSATPRRPHPFAPWSLLVLVCSLGLATRGLAQTVYTWTGGGANANWSTGANWAGNTKPVESGPPDAQLVFAGTTQLTPNMDSGITAASGGFN